ncbi:TonB-dependent siderophore receptor [Microbulbifer sp. 2205BS26-8]|uniref:TonB-dependent receptor plug domain-containing protein n=1 Tax=Microbulbifer sp. 2205BS26-8 TaxID=3064386 RepID=UPI00273E3C9C|nr:TonB-dependent receptor [Microbulbifer sp. 2205BS26-8]MDP5209164.1 TonB-dependent receptor [Microbulbifer sp. 2205BS26-8]
MKENNRRWLTICGAPSLLAIAIAALSSPAVAQETLLEEVITIGTRVEGRSATDSAAPIDIVTGEAFVNQGDGDLNNLLRNIVPSYNVNTKPISDAASIVRPANLRGLPPDSTLVLVNGKRRHRAAVISFLGSGVSDGAQGPDISAIPAIALKQVEVLRDGAAAQYGSDAIAGVINFQLKDAAEGGAVEMKHATTADRDGDQNMIAANIGLPLTSAGFVNVSMEYREQDATSRSVQRDDAAQLIENGNSFVASPAQIWGQPEVDDDTKFFVNSAIELNDAVELYAFGNYASRSIDGGFYFRNPETREGVFATKVLRDEDGDGVPEEILVPLIGDLDASNGIDDCEGFTVAEAHDSDECFSFTEMFPGGFTPRFGGDLEDYALVFGVRGELANGIGYDVSASRGHNQVDFTIYNTVNATLGPDSPTAFSPGGYVQNETNLNIDLTKATEIAARTLYMAAGLEWREEEFKVRMGDEASWAVGPLTEQDFLIGSNGFSGFGPEVVGTFDRDNIALYSDFELQASDNLRLGAALRWEDFSDFGDTSNIKLSGHYVVSDVLALRSTISTGFRAPTPGQSNITNVTTAFTDGKLANRGTIPPTNPIAVLKGGRQLQPEESLSIALGAIVSAGDWDVTLDFFQIAVTDRITQSANQELSDEERAQLVADGISGADSLSFFRFYTNDFDTKTRGIDLVATYPLGDATDLGFAVNWTDTEVTDFRPETMDAMRLRQLEDGLPNLRGNATLTHAGDGWRGLVRLNYYGSYWEAHLDDYSLPIDAGDEWTLDVEAAYDFSESLSLIAGAENLLNNYPDKNPWAGVAGAEYPETAPMGFNGALYYVRAQWDF